MYTLKKEAINSRARYVQKTVWREESKEDSDVIIFQCQNKKYYKIYKLKIIINNVHQSVIFYVKHYKT